MRTHLFSTAITTKAAAAAAAVVLISGGAALADDSDGSDSSGDEPENEALEEGEDDGDAYALGREHDDPEAQAERTDRFCAEEDTNSPRCDDGTTDEVEDDEEEAESQDEVTIEVEGEPSETAQAVHDVLNGEADVWPGGEGDEDHRNFGQAVSSQAKEGGLGQAVSSAARGDTASNADDEGAVAGTSGDDGDLEPAEAGSPPPHAKAHGRS